MTATSSAGSEEAGLAGAGEGPVSLSDNGRGERVAMAGIVYG